MTVRGKGWFRDPYDSRDKDAEGVLFAHSATAAPAPRDVNLYGLVVAEPRLEEVEDQGSTSACVGFGFKQDLQLGLYLATRAYVEPDPLFIYKNALTAVGGKYQDVGCYPRLAAVGLRSWGAVESKGAFDPSTVHDPIPWHQLQQGAAARVNNFYKVFGTGAALVENLRRALAAKKPFTFGQEVDRAFNDYKGGVLGKFRGASYGGHMTMCYGYDASGNFLCKNQWGSWGELGGALRRQRGYYRMSPERMMERHVTDHYAFDPALGGTPQVTK